MGGIRHAVIAGKKICNKCGENKDISEFYQRANGNYFPQCIECEREYKQNAYKNKPKPTTKLCKKCGEVKPMEDFEGAKAIKGNGLGKVCRECSDHWQLTKGATKDGHRICARCGEEVPLEQFQFLTVKNTYHSSCNPCVNKYMEEYYEKKLAEDNEFEKFDPEVDTKKCSKCGEDKLLKFFHKRHNRGLYASSCIDCASIMGKLYRMKYPDKKSAADKRWREENKERKKENDRRWGRSNRDKKNASEHKRRAIKKSVPGSFTESDIRKLFYDQNGTCVYCEADLSEGYQIDHIYALTGHKAGNPNGHNGPYNLQLLCQSCNSSKKANDPVEWERQKGYLTLEREQFLLELRDFMFGEEEQVSNE